MPRTSGVFSLIASYFVSDGDDLETDQHNPVLEDIAQALTDSLPRDGSAGMTGNLPMGAKKITNLAAGSSASDAVRKDQLDAVSDDLIQAEADIDDLEARDLAGMVKLEKQTASNDATLELTAFDNAEWGSYEFELRGIVPSSGAGPNLRIQVSIDGGSTWAATNYAWASSETRADTTQVNFGSTSNTSGRIATGVDTTFGGISGVVKLFAPTLSGAKKITSELSFTHTTGSDTIAVSSVRAFAGEINAVQFFFDTGNIASGDIALFGRKL